MSIVENEHTLEHFNRLVQQARKDEEKRVEQGVAVGSLDLVFAVATWITDREDVLKAIGDVLDKMLTVDSRSTGTFEVTVELPDKQS